MKTSLLVALALLGGLGTAGAARAQSCDAPSPIRFSPGSPSAEVSGSVARGETACWTLEAAPGARLTADVGNPERIAVFQLYRPGWRVERRGAGPQVVGDPLPGAAEGQDARRWQGVLPKGGKFLVVVGMTRGGGDYTLRVRLE